MNNRIIRLKVKGGSMQPVIQNSDFIVVEKVVSDELRQGDIIAFWQNPNIITVHRVVFNDRPNKIIITKGDRNTFLDYSVKYKAIIGKISCIEDNIGSNKINTLSWRVLNFIMIIYCIMYYNISLILKKIIRIFTPQ